MSFIMTGDFSGSLAAFLVQNTHYTKGSNRSQAPPDFILDNDTLDVRRLW